MFQDAAFIASEFISWPTAPLKTDISFYVVDQTILLDLAWGKKRKKDGAGGEMNIYLISDICIFE